MTDRTEELAEHIKQVLKKYLSDDEMLQEIYELDFDIMIGHLLHICYTQGRQEMRDEIWKHMIEFMDIYGYYDEYIKSFDAKFGSDKK